MSQDILRPVFFFFFFQVFFYFLFLLPKVAYIQWLRNIVPFHRHCCYLNFQTIKCLSTKKSLNANSLTNVFLKQLNEFLRFLHT